MTDYLSKITNGSIKEKIKLAGDIVRIYGPNFKKDNVISKLLSRYDQAIQDTKTLMVKIGLVQICAHCATNTPGGSCCGKGIEDWYDVPVLMFNLLLDKPIITDPPKPEDCLFLGPHGCRLWARHYFCVNYLCHRIYEKLSYQEIERLKSQAGKELFISWQLEQLFIKKLTQLEKGKKPGSMPWI